MFKNRPRDLNFTDNPLQSDMPLAFAKIKSIKKNRANIQLFSGELMDDVKLPGGIPYKDGKAHGVFGGFSVNQLVLVGFILGSSQNPCIIKGYPFTASSKDIDNLNTFQGIQTINQDDIVIFHKSGFSIWLTEKKLSLRLDPSPTDLISIDLTTNKVNLPATFSLALGLIPVPNGTLLKQWMDDINTHLTSLNTKVKSIQDALLNGVTVVGDGGASYKASITTALSTNTLPVSLNPVPTNLNDTNLKINSI